MIKKVGVSFGHDRDMIKNMDADFMINSGRNTENSPFRNMNLGTEELEGGFCENPHIRAIVTLGLKGEDRFNLDLGVNAIFNRWDGLYFSDWTRGSGNYWGYGGNEYISISSQSNEINFEATLNRKIKLYRERSYFTIFPKINLYGGVGTNIGYAFGSQLYINGATRDQVDENLDRNTQEIFTEDATYTSSYEYYQQRDAITQRAFATAGASIVFFKRLELGVFLSRGIGYRNHFGSGIKMVNLHSGTLRANWIIGKNKCCVPKQCCTRKVD